MNTEKMSKMIKESNIAFSNKEYLKISGISDLFPGEEEKDLLFGILKIKTEDYISKNKITLTPEMDIDALLLKVEEKYKNQPYSTIDGLKIEFEKQWVHLRKSNTEPIIRIYSEGESETVANNLAYKIIADIKEILNLA